MQPKHLFRQSAIDKMASPEQLDTLMEVTSPKGWVALSTLGAILLGTVVWGFVGSCATRVQGQGIFLTASEGLREITAPNQGILTELKIRVGSQVQPGDVVAVLDQPNLEDAVAEARAKYQDAQSEYEASRLDYQNEMDRYRNEIDNLQANLQRAEQDIARTQQRLEETRQLLEKELATRNQVAQLERELSSLETQKTQFESQITRTRNQIARTQQAIRQGQTQVDQARREYERLRDQESRYSEVVSRVSGRVVSVVPQTGDQVNAGARIATVAPEGQEGMAAVFYVPAAQATLVEEGQPAQISPKEVKREEYGFLRGMIVDRSEFPMGVEAAIQQRNLDPGAARDLLGNGSFIEVQAELQPDTDTPSGYKWSSSTGPPFAIAPGTLFDVDIVVSEKPPVQYVIPFFRSVTGVS